MGKCSGKSLSHGLTVEAGWQVGRGAGGFSLSRFGRHGDSLFRVMSAFGYSLVTVAVTALLALAGDRIQARRAAVAEALVSALTDAQRPTFLLDLANADHAVLVTKPLEQWVALLASVQPPVLVSQEQMVDKVNEILGWRMAERRERIRFAAVGRAREIHHLACYYRAIIEAAADRGEKIPGRVGSDINATTDELVRTVAAVRVPSALRPLHALARQLPGLGVLLVSDDDLRMLVADYSATPSPRTTDSPAR